MSHPLSLSEISIQGYKSINSLHSLKLKPLNVLIGSNGSGKSNFISFFSLLSHMIDGRFQQYIAKGGQASSFLYQGQKITQSIKARLYFGEEFYGFELEPTAQGALIFVKEEISRHQKEKAVQLSVRSDHFESALPTPPQDNEEIQQIANYMLETISGWKVYHFHDTSPSAPVKHRSEIQDNQYFRPDAANLASFLYRLKKENFAHYKAILDTVKQVAPFIHDFQLEPATDNPTVINFIWTAVNSDFPFRVDQFSDGTLRFICLATLLLQPNPPATIIIDEPEIGLHPYALVLLSNLLKQASMRVQVIITTQSVTLLDTFELEDLIIVERKDGQSVFERPDPERLKDWLCDYSLGELWEKNILGGRPAQ